jgi:RimJ/RimL family protein N-acetyltransferase
MQLQLVPFTRQDFAQLIFWSGDEDFLMQWGGPPFRFPLTEDQLKEYNKDASDVKTAERLNYKVVLAKTGQGIGHVSIGKIDRENRTARIGRVLIGDVEQRGKGLGKELVEAALNICFDILDLNTVTLGVFDFNVPAQKTYVRAGFSPQKVLEGVRTVKGVPWNIVEMSIDRATYLSLKDST